MKVKVKTNFSRIRAEQFFRFHLLRRTKAAYLYYVLSLVFLLLSVIAFVWIKDLAICISSFIVAIVIPILKPMQVNKVVKKIIKDNSLFGLAYEVIIKEDEIVYTTNSDVKNYKWDKIICVCEANDSLYFYITKDIAIIVPLYTIDESEREQLKNFVKQKVKYKKYRFKQKVEEE